MLYEELFGWYLLNSKYLSWLLSDVIIGGFILIKRLTALFPTVAAGRVSWVNPSPYTF